MSHLAVDFAINSTPMATIKFGRVKVTLCSAHLDANAISSCEDYEKSVHILYHALQKVKNDVVDANMNLMWKDEEGNCF